MRYRPTMLLLAAIVLVVAACGTADEAGAPATEDDEMTMDEDEDMAMDEDEDHADDAHGDEEFAFGQPADEADADRVVQITAADDFTFDPASVEVQPGETITFEVENVGELPHDFVIGDDQAQEEHEAEMEAMTEGEMVHDDPNAIDIPPGETASITWMFSEAGELLYGCHEPGHYDAGMRGDITASS